MSHQLRASDAGAAEIAGQTRRVTCLLTDDVLTSGVTLVEAARALREAGEGYVVAQLSRQLTDSAYRWWWRHRLRSAVAVRQREMNRCVS